MTWPQWRLALLLVGVCFFGHFNRNAMVVAGDLRIMEQYAIAPQAMGWVYSAFLITYTLFMIPGGWLLDRRGPRFSLGLVCLGSAGFIVLTALVGKTNSPMAAWILFLVVRGAMGIVNTPLHPGCATAVAQGIPYARRSAVNGLVTGAALFAVASSFVVFGGLIDLFNWPVAFFITAIATAVLGGLWLRCSGLPPVEAAAAVTAGPNDTRPALARHKNLILLTVSYAAVGYFQYLFFYWIHYYFREQLKLGDEASRFYAGIPPLAMAVCMPLGGWLSDRLQSAFGWRVARSGLGFVSMAASGVLLWFGVGETEPVALVAWLACALGILGIVEGPFWATAVEVGGARGGSSAAIFNTGGNLGGLIAPVATPFLSSTLGFGWENAISVASIVALVGACCWLAIDEGEPIGETAKSSLSTATT